MNLYPSHVRIVEVGPRDGLQNEKAPVSVDMRVGFINRLTQAGLQTIEAGAFVSPKAVPKMAGSEDVFIAIQKKDGVSYPILVPNKQGMETAIRLGVKEIAFFTAASDAFTKQNINCTIDQSFERFEPVMQMAKDNGIKVRGYVSCVMGCPYVGDIEPEAVARVAKRLQDMGCYEISLGDTIGKGTPDATLKMLHAVKSVVPVNMLAVHFHDTNGRAIDNIRVALQEGVSVVDSSASGLGGCPYAPGASGNVATEKVLDMMQALNIHTGVDKGLVIEAGRFIRDALQQAAKMQAAASLPKNGI